MRLLPGFVLDDDSGKGKPQRRSCAARVQGVSDAELQQLQPLKVRVQQEPGRGEQGQAPAEAVLAAARSSQWLPSHAPGAMEAMMAAALTAVVLAKQVRFVVCIVFGPPTDASTPNPSLATTPIAPRYVALATGRGL